MRIHIGSDHAGLELKNALSAYLTGKVMKLKTTAHLNMTHLMITPSFVFRQHKQQLLNQALLALLLVVLAMVSKWRRIKLTAFAQPWCGV